MSSNPNYLSGNKSQIINNCLTESQKVQLALSNGQFQLTREFSFYNQNVSIIPQKSMIIWKNLQRIRSHLHSKLDFLLLSIHLLHWLPPIQIYSLD